MLLNITNLTTHETEFADPSGNTTFKVKVPASGSMTDVEITDEAFAALEPLLNAEKTASRITWTVTRSAATLADDVPYHIKTMITTPYNAVADEDLVYVNLTIAGASSVVLPVAAQIGHEVTVVDGKGDSASNNITVTVASAGTINGASSFVVSTNKGAAKFIKVSATEWRGFYLVGATGAPTGAAGGDLAGSYPNPTIATAAVTELGLAETVAGAAQSLSGAGAVNVTQRTTKLTSSGAAQAITLADGVRVGQRKTIIHAVDGGSMVLTPAHPAVFATITFTAVRDWCELEWNGTTWDLVGFGGVTFT